MGKKTRITILLNDSKMQKELTFTGEVTHIQFDQSENFYNSLSIYIEDVENMDEFIQQKEKK